MVPLSDRIIIGNLDVPKNFVDDLGLEYTVEVNCPAVLKHIKECIKILEKQYWFVPKQMDTPSQSEN